MLSTLFAELFPENVAPELAVVGTSGREVPHPTLRALISDYDVTATEVRIAVAVDDGVVIVKEEEGTSSRWSTSRVECL